MSHDPANARSHHNVHSMNACVRPSSDLSAAGDFDIDIVILVIVHTNAPSASLSPASTAAVASLTTQAVAADADRAHEAARCDGDP